MKLLNLLSFREPQPESPRQPDRAVVALGGGGARGLAHLGVIQAVHESSLALERIVGVSLGALAGSLSAVDLNPRRAQSVAAEFIHSAEFQEQQRILMGAQPATASESTGGFFSWYGRLREFVQAHRKLGRAITGPALLSDCVLHDAIECLLPDIDIAETPVPLSIVAADLLSGNKVVLESGSLRQAVLASMAIPGIFPPVAHQGMLLCDIGVIDSVPIDIARAYPHEVSIAVDVGQGHSRITSCPKAIDVMMRIDEIGERMLRRRALPEADLVIRPEVDSVAWFDFSRPEEVVRRGYLAGRDQLAKFQLSQVA